MSARHYCCAHTTYMCSHTTTYVSSVSYVTVCDCMLVLTVCDCMLYMLYMCVCAIHVSSYYYICVLILLHMCPHAATYVSSFYYYVSVCMLRYMCVCIREMERACDYTSLHLAYADMCREVCTTVVEHATTPLYISRIRTHISAYARCREHAIKWALLRLY